MRLRREYCGTSTPRAIGYLAGYVGGPWCSFERKTVRLRALEGEEQYDTLQTMAFYPPSLLALRDHHRDLWPPPFIYFLSSICASF